MDDLAINEQIQEFLLHEGVSEDELIHYGVPGMRWGNRNKSGASVGTARGGPAAQPKKAPMSTKKKVAIGVGVGVGAVAAVAGAVAVHRVLQKRGNMEIAGYLKTAERLKDQGFVTASFKTVGKTPVKDISSLKVASLAPRQREGLQKVLATGDKAKVLDWLRQYHSAVSGMDLHGPLI